MAKSSRPRSRRLATTEITPTSLVLPGDPSGVPAVEEEEPETGPLRRCIVTRERLPKERMIRFVIGPDRQVVPDLAARLPGRGIWLSASGDVLESGGVVEEGRHRSRQGGAVKGGAADGDNGAHRVLVRAFARAARGPVSVPSDLSALLQAGLIRRISDFLGLARRAGQAVAGFEKAREVLRTGRSRLVLQASDGSEAERMRFLSGFRPGLVPGLGLSGTGLSSAGLSDTATSDGGSLASEGSGLAGSGIAGSGIVVIDPLSGDVMGRVFGRDYVVHVAVAPGKLAESLVFEAGRLAGLKNRSARAMGSGRATGLQIVPVNEVLGANG